MRGGCHFLSWKQVATLCASSWYWRPLGRRVGIGGFPKAKGTFLRVPITRIMIYLGSILGSPHFGKLPARLAEGVKDIVLG